MSEKLFSLYKPITILIIYLFIFDIILTSRVICNFGIEHELNAIIYNSYINPGYFILYMSLVSLSFAVLIFTYHYPSKFNFYLLSSFLLIYYLMNINNILTAIRLYAGMDFILSLLSIMTFTMSLIFIFSISYIITRKEKDVRNEC